MITAAAIAACVILGALAVFQLLLAMGRPLGRFAWGGKHEVLPTNLRVGSLVTILAYAAFATVILDRAGLIAVLPEPVPTVGAWVLVGFFALGVLTNAISRSKPERYTMTPVNLVLALLVLPIALS